MIGYTPRPGARSMAGWKQRTTIQEWRSYPLDPTVHLPESLIDPEYPDRLFGRYGVHALTSSLNHHSTAESALITVATLHPGYLLETGRGEWTGATVPSLQEIHDAAYTDDGQDLIAVAFLLRVEVAGNPTPDNPGRFRTGPAWRAAGWAEYVRRNRGKRGWLTRRPALSDELAEVILSQVRTKIAAGEWREPMLEADKEVIYG